MYSKLSLFMVIMLFTLCFSVQPTSAFTKDVNCSFDSIKGGDLVCIYINGTDYHSVVKKKLKDRVILFDSVIGEYTLNQEEFNKVCIGKEINGDEMTPSDQSTYAVEVPSNINPKELDINPKDMISVWIYGPFWSYWRWAYGYYWVWYTPDGKTHYFMRLGPAWHVVYGSFKINYWHIEQRWYTGTLPWNYVKIFTPKPTYENLHYQGQK